MSLYSDFQKDNNKKSGKSLYAKFKEKENLVKPTFTQRMTGEPVKQRDGTYKATTGVTDVLSGLPIIGPFARLGKTLGETMAYNELDDETREYLDKTGTTRDIVPDIDRSNLEIYADTAEAMTDAATGGISGLYRKGAVNTLKLSPLKVRNLADLKLTSNQILKRFGIETGLNTASGYSFDVAQNARDGKKGADVFKPGIGTAGAALLSSVMGGRSAAQLQKANSAARITDKYAQKFNIPEAGSPFDNIKPKTGIMDNIFVNKPTEKLDINVVPGARYVTPEVTPKTPMESRALKSQSKNDFISNEIAFMNRTKQPLNSNFMKQVDSSWDKMHPKPIQEKIPTSKQVGQDIPNTKTIPEQPNVKQATPEQSRIETPETRADIEKKIKSLDEDEVTKDFTPQQKKQNIEYFNSIEGNESKVKNIAMGLDDDIPEGVNPNSIWKLLSDKADSMGDGKLALELSQSPLRKKISVEAQNLSMTNIGDKGVGLTKKIEIINKKLKDMVSKNTDIDSQTIKEVDNIKETVAKILKESKVDMKYVDEILEGIRCK